MAVRLSPVRWALILLVVGLAGVAAAVALWWPGGTAVEVRRAQATVTTPAPCGGSDTYDRVELKLDGQARTAKLDGCGHREGEAVEVVLPADTTGDFTVQVADSTPVAAPFGTRLAAMLVCLSGLAGGLYAYLLGRSRQATASAEAVNVLQDVVTPPVKP
ncbi:hypothetical protein AB0I60_31595 [Actinosynnema sp. NPDC050436]|uniref:hypothetical protein n=1 Tax=Actinosynnema sp. NPDC050436 TaxID=3155659 RepID=UPI0033C47944